MARFLKKRHNATGQPPGSLIFVGQQKTDTPRLRLIDYDVSTLRDEFLESAETLSPCLSSESTSWLNVDGLHVPELMHSLGSIFDISPMVLEDIVNTGHRPKMEDFPNGVFITLKMLSLNEDQSEIQSEQLSAYLTGRCLLTFQEKPGDVFEPVRERIRRQSGRLRKAGPDYLLYALLDCVFENYLKVVEIMGERIEGFDEEVLSDPTNELLEEINTCRREMAYIRKAVRPAREIVLKLLKLENDLISEQLSPFIRDLMDMAEQINDAVDIYREMLNDHLNSYNMAVANRLNDVMKFLTIFATIFIPLSFLAGVYGMNFEVMPELRYPYGYYVLLSFMGAVAVTMLIYFRKQKWI
ncbi:MULTISPECIES: magnesium/cobalt transporter CorA [unclassified Pseudodesulfovibrio]|uniref:magnesium/cobalt transporter CorA n=1 Tax=unclassified Pseudodesulfovibrio TaxID=2661612 RepID=UPI000FEB8577|nr:MULTISPECIES: magnesium/cobalt transporter CorA [unclassified Pseudodesulfovibrio]MCJ2164382.1 magnesium/cobalt transporter CorA [Pseudodesulfovibrio sp. S3-i]RWU04772.1 magnesium and cobalt transport protein CorA [Pseudodesulfovibrio sp. S3]